MPDGLHEFAIDGNCKKVAELIAGGADVDKTNAYGNSPLYSILGLLSERKIDQYRAIILLLEAGANPLQPQPGDEFWVVNYPLFAALQKKHLAQVLLLLWYVPDDYKKIKMTSPDGCKFSPTFQSYIEMTGEIEAENGKHRDYVRCVNETAADAKHVRELFAEAKRYLEIVPQTTENAEKAARCYNQAAQIYQKHEEREDSLVYFPHSSISDRAATPKQLHALLKGHYRHKKQSCLEKEFACYQLAERELVAIDEESVRHHIEIINRLIELSKLLAKEAELRFYLGRVATITMRLPDRRTSEATVISAAEVAVHVEEDPESDRETAPLLIHTSTGPTSLFGSLSALRRRHVPVAAAKTSTLHVSTFKP